ncbi:protein phosphatase 1 regulatory inhibitor subunit 16B [Trichonephila clavipes]|nr:protein phosphatase 1 regulatory inhibitor subunit 16B [Trichonephila clavipes]
MRATEKEKLSSNHSNKDEDVLPCSIVTKDTVQRIKGHNNKENNDSANQFVAYDQNEDGVHLQTQYLNSVNDNMTNEFHKQAIDDMASCEYGDSVNAPVIQHSQSESVKVEIHVTVNTNAQFSPNHGTLADLKKHRSDMRSRGSLLATSQQDVSEKGSCNGHTFSATYMYDRPPSPTISLRRFCSDPSEVVGGEVHKQGCCIIM